MKAAAHILRKHPSFHHRHRCLLFICLLIYSFASLYAQPASDPSPKIDLMVKGMLSESTEPALRQDYAQELIQDPSAYPALMDVLQRPNNISAKTMICRAMVSLGDQRIPGAGRSPIPGQFIDPLFQLLLSDNNDLARAAAQALAYCQNGVIGRLEDMVTDPSRSLANRLAGIQALKSISQPRSVLILAELLDDAEPQIKQDTAQALAQMLFLPEPLDSREFRSDYLPQLRDMDTESFLLWLLQRRNQQIHSLRSQMEKADLQIQLWQGWYLDAQTKVFQSIPDLAQQLEFLIPFISDQQVDSKRIWAAGQINQWTKTASVSSGPITANLLERIRPLIQDPNPQVRQLTAITLSQLDFQIARAAAPDLLDQLAREPAPSVSAAILTALGQLEYLPAMEPAMERILPANASESLAQEAVRSMGRICAAHTKDIKPDQFEQISIRFAQVWSDWPQSDKVRGALIDAMRKISTQPEFQPYALLHFKSIFIQALENQSPQLRSSAVYALSDLLKRQVLTLLLEEPYTLLNDPDLIVRYAVISAIQQHGGPEHLQILLHRLEQEPASDLAVQIRSAFTKLLETQTLDVVFEWTGKLNELAAAQPLLYQEVLHLLVNKIGSALPNGNSSETLEYELFAYPELAHISLTNNQPFQALAWYRKLLALPLSQDQKKQYAGEILRSIPDHIDIEFLRSVRLLLEPAITEQPTWLDELKPFFAPPQDAQQDLLLPQAYVLAELVIPLLSKTPDLLQQNWMEQINHTALALIDRQEKTLRETQIDEPLIMDLLSRLDKRLTEYPPQAPIPARLETLGKFRQLIQPGTTPENNSSPISNSSIE